MTTQTQLIILITTYSQILTNRLVLAPLSRRCRRCSWCLISCLPRRRERSACAKAGLGCLGVTPSLRHAYLWQIAPAAKLPVTALSCTPYSLLITREPVQVPPRYAGTSMCTGKGFRAIRVWFQGVKRARPTPARTPLRSGISVATCPASTSRAATSCAATGTCRRSTRRRSDS